MSDKTLDLRGCVYAGKSLAGKTLAGALMSDADLSKTNLQEAVLTKVRGPAAVLHCCAALLLLPGVVSCESCESCEWGGRVAGGLRGLSPSSSCKQATVLQHPMLPGFFPNASLACTYASEPRPHILLACMRAHSSSFCVLLSTTI